MKKLKYDYTELDEFLLKERPEKETISCSFFKLIEGYMNMATYIISHASSEVEGRLTLDDEASDFVAEFVEIFRILQRLPEMKEGGES